MENSLRLIGQKMLNDNDIDMADNAPSKIIHNNNKIDPVSENIFSKTPNNMNVHNYELIDDKFFYKIFKELLPEKENPGLVSSEKKSFKSMPQVGADQLPSPFTTEEMLEKISKHDKEGLDKLSIERVSGFNTSTYAFHNKLKWFAIDTYNEGKKMDDRDYSKNCLQGLVL